MSFTTSLLLISCIYWCGCIYSTLYHSISLRYIILYSHLCADWFISVSSLKTLYAFLISPIQVHAKCLAHVFIQTSSAKCDADLWLHRKLTSSVLMFSENVVLWMEGCLICRAFYIWVNTAFCWEYTSCSTFLCSYLHPIVPPIYIKIFPSAPCAVSS